MFRQAVEGCNFSNRVIPEVYLQVCLEIFIVIIKILIEIVIL